MLDNAVPRFEPFAGVRYRQTDLSSVVCPPYDVISEPERVSLQAADPHNAVALELPVDRPGEDRYRAAAADLARWLEPGGPLVRDEAPVLTVYRMSYADETGQPRSTTGVLGALGLQLPGEGDVLPHERTTPKAKSDRLDLLRATSTNLSPVWGLSLAGGLSLQLGPPSRPPDASARAGGVVHAVWKVPAGSIGEVVASAPVVIADGHHRYEVALAYQAGHDGPGPWDSVLAYIVELSEEQLNVAAIHRLISGLPGGFDLAGAMERWFEPVGSVAVSAAITERMVDAGALALVTGAGASATLLRPRPETVAAATHDLDSSRLDVALAGLPPHELTFQHGVDNVADAVADRRADAGVLVRPATVAQIASVAHARDRMPPKTTFFTPKPATGLVFRPAG